MNIIKRAWILSDTHFGIKSNSVKWLKIQLVYLRHFIKMVKENYREGDIIIHCGDLFDNRQSINILVSNKVQEIMEELSNICDVHIICGNHDIYKKNDNSINSLKYLNNIKGVKIYEKPKVLDVINNQSLVLLPWVSDKTKESDLIEILAKSNDFLFAHSDVSNVLVNRFTTTKHGVNVKKFQAFKRAFTGHIHWRCKIGNLQVCGTPYQLTRGDIGNDKMTYLYDFETDKLTEFPNNISPKFKKLNLQEILEIDIKELKEKYKNTFLDLYINQRYMSINTAKLYEIFDVCNELDIQFTQELEEYNLVEGDLINMKSENDILLLAEKMLDSNDLTKSTKENVLEKFKKLLLTYENN